MPGLGRAEQKYGRNPAFRTLGSLAFCAFLDAADFAMLPGMFRAFETDFGASLSDIGLMYLLQCLVGSLALPVWGGLGDRSSRKMLLCLGCFAWGALTLGCAMATTFMEFTFFRTIAAVFMSLVSPISQSVVADLAPSSRRGRLFGQIGGVAMLGALCGQFMATSISEDYVWGIRGWRLSLIIVGGLSLVFPFLMAFLMIEPNRRRATILARENAKDKLFGVDWPSLQLPSFWLLVLQGVFGCIPWRAFGMFSVLWLELIGYSSLQAAIIVSAGMLASAAGHFLSGYVGDYAHSVTPYRGRVFVAQFTVAIGMILIFFLLMVVPKDKSHLGMFLGLIVLFNLMATWAGNATNRPLIADIVPEWSRASVYSYFSMMENVPSSFGGYLVSFLAEFMFGFKSRGPHSKPDLNSMSEEERRTNVKALTLALSVMTLVPWTFTFLAYGAMHRTYENDVRKSRARQRKLADGLGSNDDNPDDIEDDEIDKVCLLAEGRRGL